jgi:predicted nucleic acid-binding protein
VIVISDTSPLSYLHQIGRLALLHSLYEEIIIPPAVENELRAAAALHAVFDWSLIRVVPPASVRRVEELLEELDRGESEAVIVALELGADLLLIDERSGREVARRMGLPRTGLLGVLLEANNRGLIASVAAELDRLVAHTTFRIHPTVRAEVLRLARETSGQ